MNKKGPKNRTLQVLSPAGADRPVPRKHYARWRALSLSLVYVVFAIHIIHWKVTGKTLAPLELNEVMYTLELGIITAGFLFMCALVLGTLVFGRFFCSWACHIMVLQDLCGWILRKCKIRPRLMRFRLFLFVPGLTAFYMFVWPQLVRTWNTNAFPTFHLATDRDGWASFATNNFWRNLPGPWIIVATLVVCGFSIVYLLGSRTFCTYVCPYGAVFGLADRFAPGKIRVNSDCLHCGKCTAACTSGIRVHEETARDGMVVNPACLKDLDCVSACPQGALRYAFGKPAFFRSYFGKGRFGVPYEFSLVEELIAALVFLCAALSLRGLYSRIPFLLALALGVIGGFLAVSALRLVTKADVEFAGWSLKRTGKTTPWGRVYGVASILLAAALGHCAIVRYSEFSGLRSLIDLERAADAESRKAHAHSTYAHLISADHWGIMANERVERGVAIAAMEMGRFSDVERFGRRFLGRHDDDRIRLFVASALVQLGKDAEAESELKWIVRRDTPDAATEKGLLASAYQVLGGVQGRRGDFSAAVRTYGRAVELAPDRAAVHAELGTTLAELGRFDEATSALETAVQLNPRDGRCNYNLGTLLGMSGRFAEAIAYYDRAIEYGLEDADIHNNYGFALVRVGRVDAAREHLEKAISLNPDHADAHFNLGALLMNLGENDRAEVQFRLAASLDRRYWGLFSGN